MVSYANADKSMFKDRRAISGYTFIIDRGAVSWSLKKQEVVLLSMTESEYVATISTKKAHGSIA